MKKLVIYIISIIFSTTIIFAKASDIALFKEAGAAYNEGKYRDALMLYDSIRNKGIVFDRLYYNMGNTYFRLKDYPHALLYFEKAKLLNPVDEAIDYNIALTKTLTGDKIDAVEEFFIQRWINIFINFFSFETWRWISFISFVIGLFSIGLYLFTRSKTLKIVMFWMALLMMASALKSYLFSTIQYNMIIDSKTAIIISPTVTVKSSPADNGSDLFVIHDGTKVDIIQLSGKWAEIKISDGNKGWIKISDYEKI